MPLRQWSLFFSGSTGVGLEPSSEGIDILKRHHEDSCSINFVRGSAHQIPFPSNKFDLVTAWSVLHWIGRDEYMQALGELVRVTGSYLVIMDFHPLFPYRTQYSHKKEYFTFKHDFEPVVLTTGIMRRVASSQWRVGQNRIIVVHDDDRSPFTGNPVN